MDQCAFLGVGFMGAALNHLGLQVAEELLHLLLHQVHLLAHGFQTLIHTAPGAGTFPFMVEESLVGFLEQSSRFAKPVYAGDTIYPALEVAELTPGRSTGVVTLCSTVFNKRRELVLEGMQKFLIRRKPA